MRLRPGIILFTGLFIGLWLMLASCGGQLFKVVPRPVSPPAELIAAPASGNLEVSAFAVADDDRAFEQFGANLPLAGLIAVDARLMNRTAAPINARALKFELRDATGKQFKIIAPKKALKRLMKFYQMRIYGLEAYRRTRADLETLALQTDHPLAPQEERRGVLFFEAKRDVAALAGLTLSVQSRKATDKTPITVRLN